MCILPYVVVVWVLSQRYKCIGVIDQKGKSSFGLFLSHSSFNQGSWVRFSAGSQRIVDSFGAGMPCDYYW